jgi:hypothetical protein
LNTDHNHCGSPSAQVYVTRPDQAPGLYICHLIVSAAVVAALQIIEAREAGNCTASFSSLIVKGMTLMKTLLISAIALAALSQASFAQSTHNRVMSFEGPVYESPLGGSASGIDRTTTGSVSNDARSDGPMNSFVMSTNGPAYLDK